MESFVLLRSLDRVREAIGEQQAVGQAGEFVGDGFDGDVSVSAHQACGRSAADAYDRHAASGPAIPPVLVSKPVAEFEFAALFRARRVYLAKHVRQFLGVNPVQPLVGRVSDFMLLAPDQRDPSRGEVNPVRTQIPFPQCLVVGASAGSTLFHLVTGNPRYS